MIRRKQLASGYHHGGADALVRAGPPGPAFLPQSEQNFHNREGRRGRRPRTWGVRPGVRLTRANCHTPQATFSRKPNLPAFSLQLFA
jgi:hypothetical protein